MNKRYVYLFLKVKYTATVCKKTSRMWRLPAPFSLKSAVCNESAKASSKSSTLTVWGANCDYKMVSEFTYYNYTIKILWCSLNILYYASRFLFKFMIIFDYRDYNKSFKTNACAFRPNKIILSEDQLFLLLFLNLGKKCVKKITKRLVRTTIWHAF